MLRVVFDSECDEELRVGDGVVYERSFVITVLISDGISEHITVIESIGLSDLSFIAAVCSTYGITIISADDESISGSVIAYNCTSFGISVDGAVPGQYNVRCVGGDRGE